jgi:hypothetical protein
VEEGSKKMLDALDKQCWYRTLGINFKNEQLKPDVSNQYLNLLCFFVEDT